MLKNIIVIFSLIIIGGILYLLYILNFIPHLEYSSADFGIVNVTSDSDQDGDGIDDYSDILAGAKITADNAVRYHSGYYQGGYPPVDEGVCTDVIWRSLSNAGYDLKAMIDQDIAENVDAYPRVEGQPDPNIDFRRVPNQQVYFERHAKSLTTDLTEIDQWMPGDIVVFGDDHIAIVSDVRNRKGIPFIIHSGTNLQLHFEEDKLELLDKLKGITGHYRLDFS